MSATHLARYRAAQRWIATNALRLKDSSFKLTAQRAVLSGRSALAAMMQRSGDQASVPPAGCMRLVNVC